MFLRNFSIALILALGVTGYPVLASILSLLGASDSNIPSIFFRLTVVFIAIAAIVLNRKNLHVYNPLFVIAVAVFWVGYFSRIIYDSYIVQNLSDLFDPFTVIVTALTFVLIPMLPSFIGLNEKNRAVAYKLLLGLTIIGAALMLLDSRELLLDLGERNQVRYSLEKLNPISVGYVGGILLILSTISVLSSLTSFNVIKIVACAIGGGVGLFILLVAGSRGPAVAAFVALAFYWLVPIRFPKLLLGLGLVAILGTVVVNIQGYVLQQFDIDVSTRFVEAQEGESSSIDSRGESFDSAWQQFKENPLFGDALFEKSQGTYPHNLILEALMATGIVGGAAYLLAIIIMLIAAVRLLARENGYEWLALLGIFFLIASQFSGSHWSFGAHWQTMILVVTAEVTTRAEQRHDVSVRRRRRKRR